MKAVVITYEGPELPTTVITEIGANVMSYGKDIKIQTLDEKDLCKAIVQQTETLKKSEEQMAIESAVIYIGEKFAEWLTGPQKSMPVFLTQLSARLTYAKMYGTDENLVKAVNILCTHTGKIPAKLSKKYGFNDVVLATIKTANVSDFHF